MFTWRAKPGEDVGDDSDEDDDVDYDEDKDYDEEDEDLLREFEREAMDAASAIPEFYNPNAPAPELDELAEERKGNPFIKLLSALRGEKGSFMYMSCDLIHFLRSRSYVLWRCGFEVR